MPDFFVLVIAQVRSLGEGQSKKITNILNPHFNFKYRFFCLYILSNIVPYDTNNLTNK